jgi:hypothetical protein
MPATSPIQTQEEAQKDVLQEQLDLISERILHALEIFHFLSLSAIHQQIGTSTPRGIWQPLLQKLVEDGQIHVTEVIATTPLHRTQSYTVFHLAKYPYATNNPDIKIQPAPQQPADETAN